MAKLKVVTAAQYLTQTHVTWRGEDHTARQAVKAVKGEAFNGYFNIRTGNGVRRFDKDNAADFLPIVHRLMANAVRNIVPAGRRVTLVPIPNSHVVAVETPDFRTRALAEAIATIDGNATCCPALVFNKPQPKSSTGGGSRDPDYLASVMRLLEVPAGEVVLVDDVKTTGGHLIAATRMLVAAGCTVSGAVAFGRATHEQEDTPLSYRDEEIEIDPPEPVDVDDWPF